MSEGGERDESPASLEPSAGPRKRDRVAVLGFLLVLWLPILMRSTVPQYSAYWAPMLLKLHSISCLFTHKPEGWSSYYVQVRYPGREHWVSLDQSELFPLKPFGRRTRMHRLLVAWKAKEGPLTEDMARWIVIHNAELHPDDPMPEAIRFARSWMIPSRDNPPQHGWVHPEWEQVPPKRRRVIATYRVADLLASEDAEARR